VVTLDLVMPHLDGIGFLKALPRTGAPRVVLVSTSGSDSELVAEAFALGAVELVHKPTPHATERLYEMQEELARKILLAAGARPLPAELAASPPPPVAAAPQTELVVVGTSTGGPQALVHLLSALPANLPVPVAIALHIPAEYTGPLAQRLDANSPLQVSEVREGELLRRGRAVLARGGVHLSIERAREGLRARLSREGGRVYVPSVDVLFESAARAAGGRVIGVVLTGLGDDGVAGARRIREAGGRVFTESASSCVVYGMPRSVADAGLSSDQAPLSELAALIVRSL
jgi:two-component system chemotaxis response regulator CheB